MASEIQDLLASATRIHTVIDSRAHDFLNFPQKPPTYDGLHLTSPYAAICGTLAPA